MTIRSFLIAFGLLCATFAWAQTERHVCGTSFEDQQQMEERLLKNIAAYKAGIGAERGAITYIPVHFHLVKNSNGAGEIPYTQVLDALCGLNSFYAEHEIQFYYKPANDGELWNTSISSDGVYTTQDNTFLMQLQKQQNAVNIYVSQVAASGSSGPGQVLAYYSPSFDWIVTRKDQMNKISSTLGHELGHYFSLMHTFWGWEGEPFGPGSVGWPTAPVLSPSGRPTEYADRNLNCGGIAGDGFCDTPPDYNFGLITGGCNYNGGAKDPNGVIVDPMEENIMSYFDGCDQQFTPNQMAAVRADLAARSELNNSFSPVATEVNTPADFMTFPQNMDVTPYFNFVETEWKAVAGATHYLVELDIIPNYLSPNAQAVIVEENSYTFDNLNPNTSYYMRVRPFNYAITCADAVQVRFFTNDTPLANREIKNIREWNVLPNPVSANEQIQISLDAAASFEANVRIFDLAGKEVFVQNSTSFSQGKNIITLEQNDLSNGIYLVKLESGNTLSTKKLVVLR